MCKNATFLYYLKYLKCQQKAAFKAAFKLILRSEFQDNF